MSESDQQVSPEARAQFERAQQESEWVQAAQALEIAALKAGIDLSTRNGKAWAQTYDGDWDDPTAMMTDFRAMFGADTDDSTPANPTEGMAGELQQLAGGTPPSTDTAPPADYVKEGYEAMHKARQEGRPEENARAEVINRHIDAAVKGLPGAVWSDDARREWMEDLGVA